MKCELLYSLCTIEKRKKMNHYSFVSKYRCTWFRKNWRKRNIVQLPYMYIYFTDTFVHFISIKIQLNLIQMQNHADLCWITQQTLLKFYLLNANATSNGKNDIAANMNLNPEIHIKLQCENLMQRYSILTARFCRLHR